MPSATTRPPKASPCACQARGKSDLVVEIAASSAMCKTRPQSFDATIGAVERLSPTTLAFTLEGAGPVAFLPGQYANLQLPGSPSTAPIPSPPPPATRPSASWSATSLTAG